VARDDARYAGIGVCPFFHPAEGGAHAHSGSLDSGHCDRLRAGRLRPAAVHLRDVGQTVDLGRVGGRVDRRQLGEYGHDAVADRWRRSRHRRGREVRQAEGRRFVDDHHGRRHVFASARPDPAAVRSMGLIVVGVLVGTPLVLAGVLYLFGGSLPLN